MYSYSPLYKNKQYNINVHLIKKNIKNDFIQNVTNHSGMTQIIHVLYLCMEHDNNDALVFYFKYYAMDLFLIMVFYWIVSDIHA